jgi:hypothetical protein
MMMENLYIKATDECPEINFLFNDGKLVITGKSLPENVNEFYEPVLDWLAEYSGQPKSMTEVDFNLSYFNTASSKIILDILLIIEKFREDNRQVIVNWHYQDYDEDMKEAGEEYSEIVGLQFNFINHPS